MKVNLMPSQRKSVRMQTKHMSKQEKLERELAEQQYRLGREQLAPPEWLDETGAEEFRRIVEETGKPEMLDNGDMAVLAVYADSYSRYSKASLDGDAKGRNEAAKIILQCSARLGLTATDRLRLTTPKKEKRPENKFLKFLNN